MLMAAEYEEGLYECKLSVVIGVMQILMVLEDIVRVTALHSAAGNAASNAAGTASDTVGS